MKKSVRPEPVPTNVVCSLCGEAWSLHREDERGDVTTLECIRILKAKKPQYVWRPQPVFPAYPAQPWYSSFPTITTSGTSSRLTTTNTKNAGTAVQMTPTVV